MNKFFFNSRGLTIGELLLVIAIIVILAVLVVTNFVGVRDKQNLDLDAKSITAFLRDAQQRSIIQENDNGWGIIFVNPGAPEADSYAIFYGATYTGDNAVARKTLHSSIEYENPIVGGVSEIVFGRINGLPNVAATIKIRIKGVNCLSAPNKCAVITVNSNGTITY